MEHTDVSRYLPPVVARLGRREPKEDGIGRRPSQSAVLTHRKALKLLSFNCNQRGSSEGGFGGELVSITFNKANSTRCCDDCIKAVQEFRHDLELQQDVLWTVPTVHRTMQKTKKRIQLAR
jgi:hypothetical protein